MFRLPPMTITIIAAAAAIIISSVFCSVSAQAPVGAPFQVPMGPSAAAPSESSSGPAAAGPAASDCTNQLLNMSDCLSYVVEGSNLTAPDKNCCPELAGLVDSNPICLCQLLGSANSFGISIDLSRALSLPSICKVSTPPVSLCSVVGQPVGAPASSPVSTLPGVQPPGLAANPTSGKDGSEASSIVKTDQAFSFVVLTVAFVFTFF